MNKFTSNSGFVLLMSIFLILAFAVLGMASLSLMSARIDIATRNLNSAQAYYIAEGARQYFLEYVINWDTNFNNNNPDITRTLGTGTFTITYPTRYARSATVRFRATIASPQGDITRSLTQQFDGTTSTLVQDFQRYCAYFGATATEEWQNSNIRFFGDTYTRTSLLKFGSESEMSFGARLYVAGDVYSKGGVFNSSADPERFDLCVGGNFTLCNYQYQANDFIGNICVAGDLGIANCGGYSPCSIQGSVYIGRDLAQNSESIAARVGVNELVYVGRDVHNHYHPPMGHTYGGVIGDNPADQLHYKGSLVDPPGTINATQYQEPGSSDPHYGYANCLPAPPAKPTINTTWSPPTSYSYFTREISRAESITSSNQNPTAGLYYGAQTFNNLNLAGRNSYVNVGSPSSNKVTLSGSITGGPANIIVATSYSFTGGPVIVQIEPSTYIEPRISIISECGIIVGQGAKIGAHPSEAGKRFIENTGDDYDYFEADEGCLLYSRSGGGYPPDVGYCSILLFGSASSDSTKTRFKGRLLLAEGYPGLAQAIGLVPGLASTVWGLVYGPGISSGFGRVYGSIFVDLQPRNVTFSSWPNFSIGDFASLSSIQAYSSQPSISQSLIPLCIKDLYDITRTNLKEE